MTTLHLSPHCRELPYPDAILFDWDNTLVDSWPTIQEALNHCLEAMGHAPWDRAQVMANSRLSMRDAFPKLFGEDWEKAAKIFQEYHSAIHIERLKALPEAEAMLKQLRQAGLFVAAVSNKRGPALRREIEALGWNPYFDAIIGAGDAEKDKPHPHPARLALTQYSAKPDPVVWFVGDTVVDLECGAAIGATCVYYGDQGKNGELEGIPFDCHMESLRALTSYFAQ